jgi:DnaJ family protein C protein 11
MTAILATGVEPRQGAERQKGGLIIMSAKYGVRDAPPDEVADATIAVAALVGDDGVLLIPRGTRKSRLLGFWDPAPMSSKVLSVKYLSGGKEGVVEVCGREELRLP